MKVERIKFSKEFFVLGAGEWVTAEAQVEQGEDWMVCIMQLKQRMIDVYGVANSLPESREPLIINRAHDRVALVMEDCKNLEELATFKSQCTTPELNKAYMNMVKKLT